MCVLVAQSCPTLCNPMDCSPPGSSVHGTLQARILDRVAIPFSRESSPPRDKTLGLLPCRQILYQLTHQESPIFSDKKEFNLEINKIVRKSPNVWK